MNENIKTIGIKEKRVFLVLEEVRKVVDLLKVQKGMTQNDITGYIGFRVNNILKGGCSVPYESFEKLNQLADGIHLSLQVKKIKSRTTYNKDSMKKLAKLVGMKKTGVAGKFLSENYTGLNTSSQWQCGKCGRIWKTSPNAIMYREQWCIRCLGRESWTYEQMVELAKKRGLEKTGVEGQFLPSKSDYETQSYPDRSKYQWKCGKCGHIWNATANNVKRGSWCRKCQYSLLSRKFRNPYMSVVALAKKVGVIKTGFEGKFLCSEGIYNKVKMPTHHKFKWRCGKCGDVFKMDITHVSRPQWCPTCTEGESEQVCRGYFERIFKAKFPKQQPKWLVNPLSNGQMHFDGYNKRLKLAFEFNGPQHYGFYPKYHKKYDDFVKQVERDAVKVELCKKYGITLLVVPHSLKYEEFQDNIVKEYKKLTGKEVNNKEKYDWKTFNRENADLISFL